MKQKKFHRKSSDDMATPASPMSNSLTGGGCSTSGQSGEYTTVVGEADDECDDGDYDVGNIGDDDDDDDDEADLDGCHVTTRNESASYHMTTGSGLFPVIVGHHRTNEARCQQAATAAAVHARHSMNRNQYYSSSPVMKLDRDVSVITQREMMLTSVTDSDIDSC